MEKVYSKFIGGGQNQLMLGIWKRFIISLYSGGQMQPQLGMWKRYNISLLVVDRCRPSWRCRRGLLEVCQGWTDAASAGNLEEVY